MVGDKVWVELIDYESSQFIDVELDHPIKMKPDIGVMWVVDFMLSYTKLSEFKRGGLKVFYEGKWHDAILAGEPTRVEIKVQVLTFAPTRVLSSVENDLRDGFLERDEKTVLIEITQISPKVG